MVAAATPRGRRRGKAGHMQTPSEARPNREHMAARQLSGRLLDAAGDSSTR